MKERKRKKRGLHGGRSRGCACEPGRWSRQQLPEIEINQQSARRRMSRKLQLRLHSGMH